MTLETLRIFLMWCTLINAGLLVFSVLVTIVALDWAYSIHRRLYPISKEAFTLAVYAGLGLYKVLWIVLNLVPYLATLIMDG